MAGTVTNIFSTVSTQGLVDMLGNEYANAYLFGSDLTKETWCRVCELESRLPELRLFLDEVVAKGALTPGHLNDILMAAEEAIAARADYLAPA